MNRFLVVGVFGVLLCLPALSQAQSRNRLPVRMVAPQYRIKASYAKRLVRAKLIRQTSHRRWSIKPASMRNRPLGASVYFTAIPKGSSSMLSYDATVNVAKGKRCLRGIKRVSLSPTSCLIGPRALR